MLSEWFNYWRLSLHKGEVTLNITSNYKWRGGRRKRSKCGNVVRIKWLNKVCWKELRNTKS